MLLLFVGIALVRSGCQRSRKNVEIWQRRINFQCYQGEIRIMPINVDESLEFDHWIYLYSLFNTFSVKCTPTR